MNVYRYFYWASIIVALMGLSSTLVSHETLKLMLAFACISGLPVVALISAGFRRNWTGGEGRSMILIGAAFIVGGAAFDVGATLYHSPDLKYEANPIARSLLDGGAGTVGVIAMGLLAQISLVFASLMVWMNCLARMNWYEETVASAGDLRLVGRVLGAIDNRLISLMGGRIRHDVFVSALGFFVVPVFAYRWYLGLEWFGLVPISRVVVPVALMIAAATALLAWGYGVSRIRSTQT